MSAVIPLILNYACCLLESWLAACPRPHFTSWSKRVGRAGGGGGGQRAECVQVGEPECSLYIDSFCRASIFNAVIDAQSTFLCFLGGGDRRKAVGFDRFSRHDYYYFFCFDMTLAKVAI